METSPLRPPPVRPSPEHLVQALVLQHFGPQPLQPQQLLLGKFTVDLGEGKPQRCHVEDEPGYGSGENQAEDPAAAAEQPPDSVHVPGGRVAWICSRLLQQLLTLPLFLPRIQGSWPACVAFLQWPRDSLQRVNYQGAPNTFQTQ